MNEGIISNWNMVVKPGDDVYILGDIAMCSWKKAIGFIDRMNGTKYLVAGNHDKQLIRKPEFKKRFEWIKNLTQIKIPDPDARDGKSQRIVLCHYAMLVWDRSHFDTWHLYGHSHGSMAWDTEARRMDVGIDAHNWFPISYEEVKATLTARPGWTPIDHHGTH